MFTFEQQIKDGLMCSVLYPKIIKETFEVSQRSQLLYDIWNCYGKEKYKVYFKWCEYRYAGWKSSQMIMNTF